MRNFRDLELWSFGKELAINTYKVTSTFPKDEVYGLTSQIRQAAISIPSNIAEWCSRNSNKEFIRFLEIAIGSSFELEKQLIIVCELEFPTSVNGSDVLVNISALQKKISAFINSVKKF